MKVKLFLVLLFVATGLITASVTVYRLGNTKVRETQKEVFLAGNDFPAKDEALISKSSSDIKKAKPPLFQDKVLAAHDSPSANPEIKVTDKGNNLLVLVNKKISLPENYYPSDLVDLPESVETTSSGMMLRKKAAEALVKMFVAAKKKGFNLVVSSAYRSYQTQIVTYNYWVAQTGEAQASLFSALPGHSQHQLGTAVDISSDTVNRQLLSSFGNTPEGKWLVKDGYNYGFVLSYPEGYEDITGYNYEPWHFRYIGVENAVKMYSSDLILEKYLQKFGVW